VSQPYLDSAALLDGSGARGLRRDLAWRRRRTSVRRGWDARVVDGEEGIEGRDPLVPDSGGVADGLDPVSRRVRAVEERLLDIMGLPGRRSPWSYW